ncbi:precorrin-6A reductase [Butyrivibrio sp. VCD2006]|uniref:precorrin-6A reductase n=1 Tax=Butyrivibrio sp. VCD2006 TaxID=1280664 RepID=UPI0004157F5D|nr:precorrin-6A reductase [Butyrivibrio sp. VCD2006]
MKDKILLFGGTTEGRKLSDILRGADIPHTVSVATRYGEEILRDCGENDLLVGRKNAKDIEELIKNEGYSIVVDATHPFATLASAEIKKACDNLKVEYLRLSRNTGKSEGQNELLKYVRSLDEAIEELKKFSGNILLLTGSKDLNTIAERLQDTERIYARVLPNEDSIRKCSEAGLFGKQIIAMQGPFSKAMNIALIKEIGAEVILTKESGRTGGLYEKLEAANECNVNAIVIKNPESLTEEASHYDLEDIVLKVSELIGIDIKSFKTNNSDDKKVITLAGIGPGKEYYFTKECRQAIDSADVIFGAESVVSRIERKDKVIVPKYKGEDILEYLENNKGYANPVVLYSGDISLCSGAKKGTDIFEKNGYRVKLISGISSVSLFAKALRLSLEDVRVVSAHGRECNVIGYVRSESQLIILPSDVKHADEICKGILDISERISIGYELGTDLEKIYEVSDERGLDEFVQNEKGKCLIYVKSRAACEIPVCRGLSDDEIIRGKVPMTKEEIRALSIRKLSLTRDAVLYDIGAGTGSISLEAAMSATGIKVYSIEKNAEGIELLKKNRDKFSLTNMEVVEGIAPDALAGLPSPTHVFIGGSSGNMKDILDAVHSKNEYARIVINCVTLETFSELIQIINEEEKKCPEYRTDIIQIGVTRFKKAGNYHLSNALNPVYIVTIQKVKIDE